MTLVVVGKLDLEVPFRNSEDYQITSTYYGLGVKNFIIRNDLKRIYSSLIILISYIPKNKEL
jgi:hypothetical protein